MDYIGVTMTPELWCGNVCKLLLTHLLLMAEVVSQCSTAQVEPIFAFCIFACIILYWYDLLALCCATI